MTEEELQANMEEAFSLGDTLLEEIMDRAQTVEDSGGVLFSLFVDLARILVDFQYEPGELAKIAVDAAVEYLREGDDEPEDFITTGNA